MFALTKGKWLTISPAGFFVASSRNIKALNIVKGTNTYSVSQFADHLYRPDLVERVLKGDAERVYKNSAKELNLSKILGSGSAPQIETLPNRKIEVTGNKVSVTVRITDIGGGIGERVIWRINGVTREISQKASEKIGSYWVLTETFRINPQKKNIIEVNAYNRAGLLSTEPFRITVDKFGVTSVPRPHMHILAIGVSDYLRNEWDLKYAHSDARIFSEYLKESAKGFYKDIHIKTLTNKQATSETIESAFKEMSLKVLPSDVFVLFVAGHGRNVAGSYYFLPYNLTFEKGHSVEDGIGQNQWQSLLKLINAEKSILIFDTCESAAATGLTRGSSEHEAAIDRLRHATGRSIITAARQAAYEGYNGHGVLTWTILDALTNLKTKEIDLYQLAAHIDQKVPNITHKLFGIRQRPHSKIEGNFPIGIPVTTTSALSDEVKVRISKKPTHALLRDEIVRSRPKPDATAFQQLLRGTQVRLLKFVDNSNWVLVARDGQKLGYLPENSLLPLH